MLPVVVDVPVSGSKISAFLWPDPSIARPPPIRTLPSCSNVEKCQERVTVIFPAFTKPFTSPVESEDVGTLLPQPQKMKNILSIRTTCRDMMLSFLYRAPRNDRLQTRWGIHSGLTFSLLWNHHPISTVLSRDNKHYVLLRPLAAVPVVGQDLYQMASVTRTPAHLG